MLFLLTDSPQKLKLEKVHGALIILFYVSPISPPLQSHFREDAKILSKNSTTQKILQFQDRICFFFIKNKKKTTTLQEVTGKMPNLVIKRMLELFLKFDHSRKY